MEKKRIIEFEKISEKTLKGIAANLGEEIDLNAGEIWMGTTHGTLKCATKTDGLYWLTDFGVTNDELRETTTFASACLTDGDVNHGLQSRYMGGEEPDTNSIDPTYFNELAAWANGEENIPPVTCCGLYNYVSDWLKYDSVSLGNEECERIFGSASTEQSGGLSNIRGIKTVEDVRAFFVQLIEAGIVFHPDDDFRDYVNVETKEPSFDEETAKNLNEAMEKCFEVCEASGEDIYQISIDLDPVSKKI